MYYSDVYAYARHYANETRVPQVFWHCAAVAAFGRTPLPEWKAKHVGRAHLRVMEVVRPDDKPRAVATHNTSGISPHGDAMRRAYRDAEDAGERARLEGRPRADNPYRHREAGGGWYNAWLRGWERG